MIILGISLEVLAAALGTTSKQLIAYSHHIHKPWISHLGASINLAIGPMVDASAYAFAPQVVVAPFACLDVIFNALTAPYTLRWQNEELSRVHIIATGLVAVGAFCTAVFGSVHDVVLTVYEVEAQLTKTASVVYLSVELFLLLIINLCLQAKLLTAKIRGICLGVVAGILMGNVFFVKGFIGIVRTTVSTGNFLPWRRPTPYLLITSAVGGSLLGFSYMRRGLREYKGIFMVTIFEGAHITAACLSGCVVMEEMAHAPWWQYVFYWMSVLTIVSGIMLINTAAAGSELARRSRIGKALAVDSVPTPAEEGGVPLLHGMWPQEAEKISLEKDERTQNGTGRPRFDPVRMLVSALENANADTREINLEASLKDPVVPAVKDSGRPEQVTSTVRWLRV